MVDVRPGKVVAGQEHENTNRFLQLLAVAAKHAPDSAASVANVRGGSAPDAGAAATNADAKADSKADREDPPAKEASQPAPERAESKASVAQPARPRDPEPEPQAAPSMPSQESGSAPVKADDGDMKAAGRDMTDDDVANEVSAEPKRSMRPVTAGRRPPKIKNRQVEQAKPEPGQAPAAAHIVLEGQDDDSDDEIQEDDAKRLGMGAVADTAEGQSKLVRGIEAEAKGEEKDGAGEGAKGDGQDDGAQTNKGGVRLRLRKTGADSKKTSATWSEQDIGTLRTSVQKLCQSTNPLGKCMDYVHEDLSSMSKELDHWQNEYRSKTEALERERKITEEETQPLRLRLLELEEEVKEQVAKINSMKAKISKNDQKIDQVVQMAIQI